MYYQLVFIYILQNHKVDPGKLLNSGIMEVSCPLSTVPTKENVEMENVAVKKGAFLLKTALPATERKYQCLLINHRTHTDTHTHENPKGEHL